MTGTLHTLHYTTMRQMEVVYRQGLYATSEFLMFKNHNTFLSIDINKKLNKQHGLLWVCMPLR